MANRDALPWGTAVGRFVTGMWVVGTLGSLVSLTALVMGQLLLSVAAATGTALAVVTIWWIRRGVVHSARAGMVVAAEAARQLDALAAAQASELAGRRRLVGELESGLTSLRNAATVVRQDTQTVHDQSVLAHDSVDAARVVADGLHAAMDQLQLGVARMDRHVHQLSEQASEIQEVSGTVGDIANRTTMLALNAAVEAARAGERGKGFAVVAKDIRTLATQSKQESARIAELVGELQRITNALVMGADERGQHLQHTAATAVASRDTFERIDEAIGGVRDAADVAVQTAQMHEESTQRIVESSSLNVAVTTNDVSDLQHQRSLAARIVATAEAFVAEA